MCGDFNIPVQRPIHISNIRLDLTLPDHESRIECIIENLISEPDIGLAEKQDGHRVLLAGDGKGQQMLIDKLGQQQVISVINDTPLELKAAEQLRFIGVPYIFDGEAIGGRNNWSHYIIFNVIMFDGDDWTQTTQLAREEFMAELSVTLKVPYSFRPVGLDSSTHPLQFLMTITSEAEKRRCVNLLKRSTPVSEGLIFRDMTAGMDDGEVFKFPFIHELDAVAYHWNEGDNSGPGRGGSVAIGLYYNGILKSIGALRSGLSYSRLDYMREHLLAGEQQVMKVAFLGKRTQGIWLVQPRCLEIREDKSPAQCLSSQLSDLLGADRLDIFSSAPGVHI